MVFIHHRVWGAKKCHCVGVCGFATRYLDEREVDRTLQCTLILPDTKQYMIHHDTTCLRTASLHLRDVLLQLLHLIDGWISQPPGLTGRRRPIPTWRGRIPWHAPIRNAEHENTCCFDMFGPGTVST